MLSKTGTISKFWMDQIKTHCYVTYSTVEESNNTRKILYNTIWPKGGKRLIAEFVNESEVDKAINTNKSPLDPSAQAGTQNGSTNPTSPAAKTEQHVPAQTHEIEANEKSFSGQKQKHEDNSASRREEPLKTLDQLFRKTVTKPQLYYLPLSKEEVREKIRKSEEEEGAKKGPVVVQAAPEEKKEEEKVEERKEMVD